MGRQRPGLAGLMAAFGVMAIYRGRIRPWLYTWGAADAEVSAMWQQLAVGDSIWLARHGDARQVVTLLEPGSHLVLMSPADFERVQRGGEASSFWGFYLRRTDGWTRLVVRSSGGPVGHVCFDVAHFVMERKMLCGIRDRAEQTMHREFEPDGTPRKVKAQSMTNVTTAF